MGFSSSVRPGIGASPRFTTRRFSTERLWLTMQPRTDLRFFSPVRRWRQHLLPLVRRRRTRSGERTPCIMGKPCLSLPPVILKREPTNSSPRESPSTSCAMRLSKKGRSFLSSSISMHFWRPVSEHAMLSFIFVSQPKNRRGAFQVSPCTLR